MSADWCPCTRGWQTTAWIGYPYTRKDSKITILIKVTPLIRWMPLLFLNMPMWMLYLLAHIASFIISLRRDKISWKPLDIQLTTCLSWTHRIQRDQLARACIANQAKYGESAKKLGDAACVVGQTNPYHTSINKLLMQGFKTPMAFAIVPPHLGTWRSWMRGSTSLVHRPLCINPSKVNKPISLYCKASTAQRNFGTNRCYRGQSDFKT